MVKKTKLSKEERDIRSYKRVLEEFQKGDVGKLRFRATYQKLRTVVNYRIQSMEERGLDSTDLQNAMAFNFYENRGKLFGAFTKQKDVIQTYKAMLRFLESPWSTIKKYKQASKYYNDYIKGANRQGAKIEVPTEDEFIRFIANGDFADLVRVLGNSPTAFKDAEELFNEGVSYEAFSKALHEFINGQILGYHEMLEKAKEYMRE